MNATVVEPFGEYVYRVEWWESVDPPAPVMESYHVESLTRCGAWISVAGRRVWCGYNSRKYGRTPERATEQAKRRALSYLRHARNGVERAEKRIRALGLDVPKPRPMLLTLRWGDE